MKHPNGHDNDLSIELLNEKIINCYNLCFPIKIKVISVDDQLKPGINSQIKENTKKTWKKTTCCIGVFRCLSVSAINLET